MAPWNPGTSRHHQANFWPKTGTRSRTRHHGRPGTGGSFGAERYVQCRGGSEMFTGPDPSPDPGLEVPPGPLEEGNCQADHLIVPVEERTIPLDRMLATSSVMAAWMATRIAIESGLAPEVMDWISHRPELATPVSGWKQLKEGIYLFEEGLDPYDSGVFHQSPLLLHLFSFVHSPFLVTLVYGLVDCYSAWILLRLFRSKWPKLTGPVKSIKLKDDQWMLSPTYQIEDWHLILFYLFSPLNILTSLSKSTVVFNNLAVLLALDGALQNQMAFSMFSLSIGTHLSVYPALLVPSCIGIILDQRASKSTTSTIAKSLGFSIGHFMSIGLFTPLSVLFSQLDVNKYLRPNVGLHWYFSIEMFDHFRLFFNVVFQIHLLIYILPLIIKFKTEKVFGFVVMSGVISTFKSYPSIGDTCFSNTLLLLLYPELIAYFRHPLLTISLYFYGLCLLPAFHHLWMNLGSGNANFYYASTLVWAIANGLVWIDAISAMLKRSFRIVELGAKDIDESNEVIVQI